LFGKIGLSAASGKSGGADVRNTHPRKVYTGTLATPYRIIKAAVIVLAGNESHADRGRVFNALEAAKEFDENGDDYRLIFDGACTEWIPELKDGNHDFHGLYAAVRDNVGIRDFCANVFEVSDEVDNAGVVRMDEYDGHPSIRSLVEDGYEVITF